MMMMMMMMMMMRIDDDDDDNCQARGSEPPAQIQWALGERPVSGPMVQVSSTLSSLSLS